VTVVRGRRAVATCAGATVAALAVGALALAPRRPPGPRDAHAALPAPLSPAFTPGTPVGLSGTRYLSRWAPVRRGVLARRAPRAGSPVVAAIGPLTPEGTRNLVLVVARAQDADGLPWVRVALATLPNGRTGWIPRTAVGGYETVDTTLDVDLEQLRLTLVRRGRAVLRAPIGVGAAATPTPRGRFYVRDRLTRYRSPTYGPVAFGTSARSPTLTDWPAGGFVGIHGTDRPDLVPGRVSHGCIRLRNADILLLARRMPVGTPVVVH
jgi:lipoprotein-anchoring transpeptidase ErfK/SrfK